MEHKVPWMAADDPSQAFRDLKNIAFSHKRCNMAAARSAQAAKTHCKRGHVFDAKNTYIRKSSPAGLEYRLCRRCNDGYKDGPILTGT